MASTSSRTSRGGSSVTVSTAAGGASRRKGTPKTLAKSRRGPSMERVNPKSSAYVRNPRSPKRRTTFSFAETGGRKGARSSGSDPSPIERADLPDTERRKTWATQSRPGFRSFPPLSESISNRHPRLECVDQPCTRRGVLARACSLPHRAHSRPDIDGRGSQNGLGLGG